MDKILDHTPIFVLVIFFSAFIYCFVRAETVNLEPIPLNVLERFEAMNAKTIKEAENNLDLFDAMRLTSLGRSYEAPEIIRTLPEEEKIATNN
jgi:hypothetical protein